MRQLWPIIQVKCAGLQAAQNKIQFRQKNAHGHKQDDRLIRMVNIMRNILPGAFFQIKITSITAALKRESAIIPSNLQIILVISQKGFQNRSDFLLNLSYESSISGNSGNPLVMKPHRNPARHSIAITGFDYLGKIIAKVIKIIFPPYSVKDRLAFFVLV